MNGSTVYEKTEYVSLNIDEVKRAITDYVNLRRAMFDDYERVDISTCKDLSFKDGTYFITYKQTIPTPTESKE